MKTAVMAKRLLSLALVFSMLFGLIACARSEKSSVTDTEVNSLLSKDEYTREEMELIVDLLGDGQSTEDMTDDELKALVDKIVSSESAKDVLSNATNLSTVQKKEEATIDTTGKEEFYGTDGEIKAPFDEIYPELIEKEEVEFSDETLILKLASDEITSGLKAAGVAALDEIVPLEENSWYEAKLKKGTDAKKAIEDVRALKEVLLAEYNYEINVSAIDDYTKLDANTAASLAGNDRFQEQWHFNYAGIPGGYTTMSNKGGLSSTIVAVIDSGVDYDHEDLKDNIWTNPGEIPDNGRDDDGNGFVDDYYGVNIIKGRGNADDDNGHGTHVAGIVAARNNNVGVVGVAYNTKIMPIKAAAHNGTLNQADIARAILYAYENGAEVINMSFGGTACSIAVQDALSVAYSRCVLVASAGNSGAGNEGTGAVPNYPAALGYVIGVMSIDQTGAESVFTNWDSTVHNGMDYELYAPGENILSTLPDNRYGYLSGTSMAAPMVSAMAAILRSEFADRDVYTTKFIYGQLVSTSDYTAECRDPASHANHASTKIANLNAALTKIPCPDINIQGYTIFDTEDLSNRNNGDGVIDAGEIISLGFTLKNLWGMSENTIVSVDTKVNGVADPYVTVVNSSVNYGSIGTYATGDCGKKTTDGLHTGWEQPFMVKIANNCPNDYTFTLNVTVKCENAMDPGDDKKYTTSTVVSLAVRNGVVLPPVIDEDMVLTRNNLYIIANSTIINEGVTVRVEPGTNIQFWSNDPKDPYANDYIAFLLVNGKFIVEGTKEKPVKIYPSKLMDRYNVEMGASSKGYISLKYADITNFSRGRDNTGTGNKINLADHCTFRNNYTGSSHYRYVSGGNVSNSHSSSYTIGNINAKNCVFYKLCGSTSSNPSLYGAAEKCIFVECGINMEATAKSCVFLGNGYNERTYYDNGGYNEYYYGPTSMSVSSPSSPSISAVYYREETGTTYVRASGLSELLRESMGLSYAIIETPDELDWIYNNSNNNNGYYYNLGIYYNGEKFVWSDGTDIPAFMDPDGVLESAAPSSAVSLYINKYDTNTKKLINYSTSYCLYEIPGHVLPTDITFDEYVVNIDTGATYQLSPQNTPVQIPLDAFIYESTDESVIKVSDTGLITPVGEGSASVWVYSLDHAVKNYVNVNVVDYVPLENMSFAASELTVATGELALAKCVFSPIDTTRKQVKYTSDNEAVATVDNAGIVKGIAPGKANITAECEGIKITLPVTVYVRITFVEFAEDVYVGSLADGVMELPAVSCNEGAEPVYTWRSSDETVARVEDGKLKLLKVGTTTVVVTEEASGISASFDLFVFENLDMKNIKDIQSGYKNGDNVYYVLFEDGSLYAWQNSMPALLLEGVSLISSDSDDPYFAAVMEDGSIKKCYYNNDGTLSIYATISTFSDSHRITDIEYSDFNGDNYHVITDNGNVYAWGDNYCGRLGIGTTSYTNTPTLVNLDGVVDIEVGNYNTWFLTADGELYCSGYSTNSSIPVLVDTNVTKIFDNYTNSYDFWYVKNDGQLRYTYESKILPVTFSGLSEYDDVSVFVGCAIAIKDGMVYYSQSTSSNSNKLEFSDVRPVNGITNVKALYLDRFVITEDGKIYTLESQSLGIYAKPFGEAVMVAFPTAQMSSESLLLTETSLENGVLIGDALTVGFNKRLQQVVPKLYANGEQITVKYELCEGNRIKITRAAGFTEGVEYEVVFEANTMQGLNNSKNAEEIRISFVYGGAENAPEASPENPDALPEASPEKEIHEAIVDSSIQRVPTVESFREEISLAQDKYQVNESFYGNAILNPIETIADPDKWFRPIAYSVSVGTYEEIPLGSNYWGTVNEEAIRLQMTDYTDYINYARLMYDPFLTEAPDNTFPFATSVKILNAYGEEITTVGNETVTFRITFNRDMDTSIPLLVKFGTQMGFGEYVVEGSYVDARTWEGTYTLNTLFSNGQQYISISNGCSATEDLELQPDNMRFGFVIDTTAAQALIMQGTATDTGIELKWTQDDFDTLMGYNVYRSDKEDGLYTRLNSTVIPADIMEFFDNTVEPGKVYYYNFTVVKTDLTESEPSGKITIMSKDTMAPDIYHSPVANAFTGANLVISATVTDNLNIAYANLYYRIGDEGEWKIVRMNSLNDKYSAIIIASDVTVEGIQYYIEAFDGVSFTYKGTADAPYRIRVQEAVGADSLGDVNGDGSITIYDALILLYAINDQYNMTAEEFARADLNGDGELWAAEALRILQYVNGTVGSVKMS